MRNKILDSLMFPEEEESFQDYSSIGQQLAREQMMRETDREIEEDGSPAIHPIFSPDILTLDMSPRATQERSKEVDMGRLIATQRKQAIAQRAIENEAQRQGEIDPSKRRIREGVVQYKVGDDWKDRHDFI